MIPDPTTIQVPLKIDNQGVIYVSGTRITLDTIIARYHQGDNPESIHEGFDVLPLNDIYAVISYYLAHRDEIDRYLNDREIKATRTRQEVERNYTPEQRKRHENLLQQIENNTHKQDS